ncbi:MAG: hypothetical protein KAS12_00800, partial [Candidatus Aenigmarchaeota archaeon]|nr:hypothetical protein [Candidatus Aenigmarchaeota archaeon]
YDMGVDANHQTPIHLLVVEPKKVAGCNTTARKLYQEQSLGVSIPNTSPVSSDMSIYLGLGKHNMLTERVTKIQHGVFKNTFNIDNLYTSPFVRPNI